MFSLANTRKKIATHAHHNYHKEKKRKKERMRGGGGGRKSRRVKELKERIKKALGDE
jgi:hypothetical protein